jgi:hypothetical protein
MRLNLGNSPQRASVFGNEGEGLKLKINPLDRPESEEIDILS